MNSSYEASRIADGFAQLASIFMPNTGALIEADLNRRKANNIDADTNRTNVDATRLAADRDRIMSERAVIDQQRAAAVELANIFASGADLNDPTTRGAAAAAVAKMKDGLQYGPSGVTGLTTYVDPNFVPDNEDFSRVIVGSGVVNGWDQTPTGTMDAETNKLIANDADNASLEKRKQMELDNETQLAKAGLKGGGKTPNPLDVTPETSGELATMLATSLASNFGVDAENVDPKLLTALQAEVAQAYQNRENAAVAIQDVLAGLAVDGDGNLIRATDAASPPPANAKGGGAGPGIGGAVDTALAVLLSGVMPQTSMGIINQARSGQPAQAAPAAAPAQGGQPLTAIGPNGERIMLDPATNQWVPVGPRRGP